MLGYGDHLQDYAERLTRAEIRDIPDGAYDFTDHIDGLGPDPETIYLKAKVIVKGDEITVDWTGSSPQAEGGINPSFPFTKASTYTAIRSIMSAEIPNCHGFTVPITVVAPRGMHPEPPFPGALRRPRHHRLPHDRLPVRGLGQGRPRQGDGGQ